MLSKYNMFKQSFIFCSIDFSSKFVWKTWPLCNNVDWLASGLNFDGVGLLRLHCMHKQIEIIQAQIDTGFKTCNIEEAGDNFDDNY